LDIHGLLNLAEVLSQCRADALICGGISREEREFLAARGMEMIDNVAGSIRELLAALQTGALRPGFGLATPGDSIPGDRATPPVRQETNVGRAREGDAQSQLGPVDCLACRDWKCLQGEGCELAPSPVSRHTVDRETERMLEAALDISSEEERTLCRLSELIYFCLEMRYQRIGVAFCADLQKPAEILVRVLRRFAKVHPVGCKIGGAMVSALPLALQAQRGPKPTGSVACNPQGQAKVLNQAGTDMNVLVGLCMGADCIFSRFSDAPVTTLFVKDRSLANNPIGAVYSDYYLKEAIQAAPRGRNQEPK
jgi:uncharacterized metal-binding protein